MSPTYHLFTLFSQVFLVALRDLLTLAVIIVFAIAKTPPSTALHSGICPVLIIIILVKFVLLIHRFNRQAVTWFVWVAAWRLNLYP
jgi:hypothetical protein